MRRLILAWFGFALAASIFGAATTKVGGGGTTKVGGTGTMKVAAAPAPGGTPAWVQDDGADFDPFNTARAVTFGSSTTTGNAIIAVYRGSNSASLVVTDSKSNTYTTVVDGSTGGIAIAAAYNITGGASHQVTFTITSSANPGYIIILEYSGIAAAAAFDQSGMASAFIANISVTTGTTTQASELVFGAMFKSSTAPTAGSGYTLRHSQGVLYTEDKNVAATGAQVVNFTHAEASASISAATFKSN